MKTRILIGFCIAAISEISPADELLYRYEGNVAPYDPSAGWLHVDPCESPPCTEVLDGGMFGLQFDHPPPGDIVNYHLWIAQSPNPPPASLWVEWNYRSNHPLGPNFYSCDGRFALRYGNILEVVNTYGNAAISFGGDDIIYPLALEELHTYRFESLDGINYRILVDGLTLSQGIDNDGLGNNYLQFGSLAGTCDEWESLPFVLNQWDFIRYGTIGLDERIVEADPPIGFLNPNLFNDIDRFTVTYDSPNYAYIDDIAVEITDGDTPVVIATKRLDNSPPNVLQVVLDRPLPPGERTTFTFNDGIAANVVSYTFQLGDINADGRCNLADFAAMQNCFYQLTHTTICAAFDFDIAEKRVFRKCRFLVSYYATET